MATLPRQMRKQMPAKQKRLTLKVEIESKLIPKQF